ncbi:MAG TPA: hypothetical protein VLC73_00135 [Burkholderiales bacterium]|nr:hypothetical protein [Burkholderiales bacterium]
MANRMKTKDKGGRPGHAPDDRSRQMVEVLSGFGIPQDKIADVIGVDGKTLRKHYATELQRGAATVEAKLVGNLLKLAGGSDGTALKAITSPCNAGSDGRSMRRLRRSGRSARRNSCKWRLRPRTPATAGANCCSDRLELRLRRLGATPQGGRPVAGSRPAAVPG